MWVGVVVHGMLVVEFGRFGLEHLVVLVEEFSSCRRHVVGR